MVDGFDDMANGWGTALDYDVDAKPGRRGAGSGDAKSCLNDFRDFSRAISTSTNGDYILGKVVSCGSDANVFAVINTTMLNTNFLLVGAGSYAAGDGCVLQSFSTSGFDSTKGATKITKPSEICYEAVRNSTVPLPYHIPGCMSDKELKEYEYDCLLALHVRCLYGKARDESPKSLLFELMLAGNGGELSIAFLTQLAVLSAQHNFALVVDEIMTAGRTGTMLMAQTLPLCIKKRIEYVTIGKWMGVGGVLVNRKYEGSPSTAFHDAAFYCREYSEQAKQNHTARRGASTVIQCDQALAAWKVVQKHLGETEARRRQVLVHTNMSEAEAWGKGVLMFLALRRTDSKQGLKNRLLPILSKLLALDTIRFEKKRSGDPVWGKQGVHNRIVESIRTWVAWHMSLEGCNTVGDCCTKLLCIDLARTTKNTPRGEALPMLASVALRETAFQNMNVQHRAYIVKLQVRLATNSRQKRKIKTQKHPVDKTTGETAIGKCGDTGILERKMVGKQRENRWEVKAVAVLSDADALPVGFQHRQTPTRQRKRRASEL